MSLCNKIVTYFVLSGHSMLSTWELGNALYNNSLQSSNKSNGAIIANIVKAANKCKHLSHENGYIHFKEERPLT
jgi:hypothetical protein